MRIPSSEYHQFTDNPLDRITELRINTTDEIVEISAGSTRLYLGREQVEQLNECFKNWLADNVGDQGKWSNFWTSALK